MPPCLPAKQVSPTTRDLYSVKGTRETETAHKPPIRAGLRGSAYVRRCVSWLSSAGGFSHLLSNPPPRPPTTAAASHRKLLYSARLGDGRRGSDREGNRACPPSWKQREGHRQDTGRYQSPDRERDGLQRRVTQRRTRPMTSRVRRCPDWQTSDFRSLCACPSGVKNRRLNRTDSSCGPWKGEKSKDQTMSEV